MAAVVGQHVMPLEDLVKRDAVDETTETEPQQERGDGERPPGGDIQRVTVRRDRQLARRCCPVRSASGHRAHGLCATRHVARRSTGRSGGAVRPGGTPSPVQRRSSSPVPGWADGVWGLATLRRRRRCPGWRSAVGAAPSLPRFRPAWRYSCACQALPSGGPQAGPRVHWEPAATVRAMASSMAPLSEAGCAVRVVHDEGMQPKSVPCRDVSSVPIFSTAPTMAKVCCPAGVQVSDGSSGG